MDAQCWVVTGPKALAPQASGPSHVPGLKGRVGSVLGPSLVREMAWGWSVVPARCGTPMPWSHTWQCTGAHSGDELVVRVLCGLR
jgi:hypothetical protein